MRPCVESDCEGVPWQCNLGYMQIEGEKGGGGVKWSECTGRVEVHWWVRKGGATEGHSSRVLDFRCIWMTNCWLCSSFRGELHGLPLSGCLESRLLPDLILVWAGRGSWMSVAGIIKVKTCRRVLLFFCLFFFLVCNTGCKHNQRAPCATLGFCVLPAKKTN